MTERRIRRVGITVTFDTPEYLGEEIERKMVNNPRRLRAEHNTLLEKWNACTLCIVMRCMNLVLFLPPT